jgi:hypothetical protein
MMNEIVFVALNAWLIATMFFFAIAQLHSRTFYRSPRWAQRGWFVVIAVCMYCLLDTSFTRLSFLPVQVFLRATEIEVMSFRAGVMAFWLTWINLIYAKFRQ